MRKSILSIPKFLSLAIFAFLLVQCSKDDDAPAKTPAELIIGSWQVTSDVFSPAYDLGTGTPVSEAYPLYEACEKDNITTFKTNSEGEFNEGATKCDAADEQTIPFLWTLKDNNTTLNISAIADFKILQLDATTLKISSTFDDGGVTYTETFTFTRK